MVPFDENLDEILKEEQMQEILKDYLQYEYEDAVEKQRIDKISDLKRSVRHTIRQHKKKTLNKEVQKKEKIKQYFNQQLFIEPSDDSFIEDDLFFFSKIKEVEKKSVKILKLEARANYKLENKKWHKAIKKTLMKKKNLRNPFLMSTDDYLDSK